MFVGCFNLCHKKSGYDDADLRFERTGGDGAVGLLNKKHSILKITDKDSPNQKLAGPNDKSAMEKWLAYINRSVKTVSGIPLEFRILNPNEPPIRNEKYVRYRLDIYDTKTGNCRWELYLIVVEDINGQVIYYIKNFRDIRGVSEPDWILLENIMRSAGYSTTIQTKNEKPIFLPVAVANAM